MQTSGDANIARAAKHPSKHFCVYAETSFSGAPQVAEFAKLIDLMEDTRRESKQGQARLEQGLEDTRQESKQGLARLEQGLEETRQGLARLEQGLTTVQKDLEDTRQESKQGQARLEQGLTTVQKDLAIVKHDVGIIKAMPTQISDAARIFDPLLIRVRGNGGAYESRGVTTSLFETSGMRHDLGALLPLHGCTSLYGRFASQLFSLPIKQTLQHSVLTGHRMHIPQPLESLAVMYVHPFCDFALSMTVNVTPQNITDRVTNSTALLTPLKTFNKVVAAALQHATACLEQTQTGQTLRATARFELDGISQVSTAGLMHVDTKLSAYFRKSGAAISGSTSKNALARVLASNDTLQQLSDAERKTVIGMQSKGWMYDNKTRLQLSFAHFAYGSVQHGVSGAPLYGVDVTTTPPTVALLGLVAAQLDHQEHVLFSDISQLVPSLQAILNAINQFERDHTCPEWNINILEMHALNGAASEVDVFSDTLQQLKAHSVCAMKITVRFEGSLL